jgi:hypothetical protein
VTLPFLRSATPRFCQRRISAESQHHTGSRSQFIRLRSRQGKEYNFVVDSRKMGRDRPNLGDLLGELLVGVCVQVQSHLVQKYAELRLLSSILAGVGEEGLVVQ